MKLGRVGGIDLHIHWSFWLLVLFYLMSATMTGGLAVGMYQAGFVLAVFACVVAHEYGHASAAARYGIPTTDITVLAFGGIARLSRMPTRPMQEFVIAIAGPLVNVAIASAIAGLMLLGVVPTGLVAESAQLTFFDLILSANVILVLFNLLPAFPMDGGRVLRSLLAMRTGHLRATEIAARIGRWMALVFAVFGLFYSFPFVLIAGFVFLAGTAELMQARVRAAQQASASPYGSMGRGFPGAFQWQIEAWPQQYPFQQTGSFEEGSSSTSKTIDAIDVQRVD